MAADQDQTLDSLYEVVPAEFVKARNALVKSLKAAGHREQADRAAKLSRPTASVWVTNQIARRAPELVGRLADATARLQGGVVRDRERYAAAINTHRELLNEVRAKIDETLHESGLRATPAVSAAAVQNFRAGLMDEAIRASVQKGRLEDDVPLDIGGGLFGGGALVAGEPPIRAHQAPAKPAAHGRPAHEDDKARERERREQARALAKARAEAERRVHVLAKAAEGAAAARQKQEEAVARLRGELERAERALHSAQASEAQAGQSLADAQAQLRKLPVESA